MLDAVLRSPSFAAFLIASLVLALTPGPGVLYLLTQTLSRGRPSGLTSVAGIALGNLANAVLASLGLAVLMATSSTAFSPRWRGGANRYVSATTFLGLAAYAALAHPRHVN